MIRNVPAESTSPEPERFLGSRYVELWDCRRNRVFDIFVEDIFFLSPFLSAIFKPTRRKPSHTLDPAELVLDSGTKAAPLVGSGNRGHALLSVSYRNVSAALSFINKVCNPNCSTLCLRRFI